MTIADQPAIVLLGLAWCAGLLSFLSPCIAPLIPGYLALLSSDVGEARPGLRRASAFVVGLTVAFMLIGAGAGIAGGLIDRHEAELQLGAGLVTAVVGVAMAAGWMHGLPGLQSVARIGVGRLHKPAGDAGAACVGAACALAWSPCIGPVLAGIIAIAASGHSQAWGALLLVAYSIGLGVPFIALAVGAGRLPERFRVLASTHRRTIDILSGITLVLLGTAVAVGWMTQLGGKLSALTGSAL